jgi:3-hydroxyacyl-CoA dehydrogenase
VAVLAAGKIGVGVNHSLAVEQSVAMYEKSVSAIEKCENKQ